MTPLQRAQARAMWEAYSRAALEGKPMPSMRSLGLSGGTFEGARARLIRLGYIEYQPGLHRSIRVLVPLLPCPPIKRVNPSPLQGEAK